MLRNAIIWYHHLLLSISDTVLLTLPPSIAKMMPMTEIDDVQTIKPPKNLDINNLPDLLTVREVATILRVSPLTIKRWGKRGKLPAIRINSRGDRRYRKESVLWLLGINPEK